MSQIRLLGGAAAILASLATCAAEVKSGPPLPHGLVENWAQLPKGWNFGEVSGVDVDRLDNVWVFNRGSHPVIQFDKNGRFLQAWEDVVLKSAHGLRVDPDGNVWLVDVKGHALIKCSPDGRVLMVIANPRNAPGKNNDDKYGFNEPTSLAFGPGRALFVSDGYVNSRVVHYTRDGEYIRHWGTKGKGDGEFDLVHDVTVDRQGRVYVADRNNRRVQVFDPEGRFIAKWTDVGTPWGLYYVAREDAIYMCDGENNRIVKLNLDGQILGVLGEFGKAPGKLDFVHAISVDSTGAIYVAEIKNWRVQKFSIVR